MARVCTHAVSMTTSGVNQSAAGVPVEPEIGGTVAFWGDCREVLVMRLDLPREAYLIGFSCDELTCFAE